MENVHPEYTKNATNYFDQVSHAIKKCDQVLRSSPSKLTRDLRQQ